LSRSIRAVGYDRTFRILEVEFKRRGVYQYLEVSAETYEAFLAAPSKGSFFDRHIRDNHSYRKVDDVE